MIAEVTGERVSGDGDGLRLSEDLHLDSLGTGAVAVNAGTAVGCGGR